MNTYEITCVTILIFLFVGYIPIRMLYGDGIKDIIREINKGKQNYNKNKEDDTKG